MQETVCSVTEQIQQNLLSTDLYSFFSPQDYHPMEHSRTVTVSSKTVENFQTKSLTAPKTLSAPPLLAYPTCCKLQCATRSRSILTEGWPSQGFFHMELCSSSSFFLFILFF